MNCDLRCVGASFPEISLHAEKREKNLNPSVIHLISIDIEVS